MNDTKKIDLHELFGPLKLGYFFASIEADSSIIDDSIEFPVFVMNFFDKGFDAFFGCEIEFPEKDFTLVAPCEKVW